MTHYLSIDFESWAYPELPEFLSLTSAERKKLDAGYVRDSAEQLIKILAETKTKLTFFTMGQLYEWYPRSIEALAAAGHEIGYHTHTHDILRRRCDLVKTLERSKAFIKRFKPRGFRSPQILVKKSFYRVLRDYGFVYSSSTYGSFGKKKMIDGILEVPVTGLGRLPIGSGYFTALLGRTISGYYRYSELRKIPVVGFVHNWQVIKPKNANFPNLKYLLKRPHYIPYTWKVTKTFKHLIKNFDFEPMVKLVEQAK